MFFYWKTKYDKSHVYDIDKFTYCRIMGAKNENSEIMNRKWKQQTKYYFKFTQNSIYKHKSTHCCKIGA